MAQPMTRMQHPEVEGLSGLVTVKAYELVYRDKGWEAVDPAVAVAADALGTEVKSLGALTKAQLEEVAEQHGLDTSGNPTKAELIASIETAVAPAT